MTLALLDSGCGLPGLVPGACFYTLLFRAVVPVPAGSAGATTLDAIPYLVLPAVATLENEVSRLLDVAR
jgi:hypothetical protein